MKTNEHKILESAHTLFLRQGIRHTPLEDIARGAGTTVKTIYGHYANKHSLVTAVVACTLDDHLRYMRINPTLSPNAMVELDNVFTLLEKQLAPFTAAMMHELRKYYPEALQKIITFRNTVVIPAIDANIARGQKEGYYRGDFDRTLYSCMYFSLLREIIDLQDTAGIPLRRAIHELNSIFLRGILTPAGISFAPAHKAETVR